MKRLILILAVLALIPCSTSGEEGPEDWRTVAEKSDFRATSTFADAPYQGTFPIRDVVSADAVLGRAGGSTAHLPRHETAAAGFDV